MKPRIDHTGKSLALASPTSPRVRAFITTMLALALMVVFAGCNGPFRGGGPGHFKPKLH